MEKHNKFIDIGDELFKLAITLSYAEKTGRVLAFDNEDSMNIIDLFTNITYEKLNTIEDSDCDKLIINFDNNSYTYDKITIKTRVLLSLLITGNSNYINFIYMRINDFMNYFKDYEISNYVCLNIKKDTYVSNYYYKAYYKHFNNKKLIIRVDDLEWADKNVNFIDKSMILFIEERFDNRFTDFILLSHFHNYIIDYNYYSWWIAYIIITNIEKKVIVPNDNNNFYLPEWIKQS